MTPERKEEIQRDYADMKEVGMYVPELLAALEEAEQQAKAWQGVSVKQTNELVEAQQTIARQKEALQAVYENSDDIGARQCVAEALGITWEGEA